LLSVFNGSLKRPSETLSHHLDASPIKLAPSDDCISPNELNIKKTNKNMNEIESAK
jgi:hypothetical protein